MPETPSDASRPVRDAAERSADHQAIDQLTTELLPALIAKLSATGLGELEVREDAWRVRLRGPLNGIAPPTADRERRPRERGADRPDRGATVDRASAGDRTPERASRGLHHVLEGTSARTDSRSVATSPAVGLFQPRPDLAAGTRVRSGDRLGAVDMLGVAQEVVAPVDGLIGSRLVEAGDAVEYGQELLVIEFGPVATSTNGSGG